MGKKPVTRQSHVAMLPTFLAAFFTLMQLKCVFAVGKTRKENALSKRAQRTVCSCCCCCCWWQPLVWQQKLAWNTENSICKLQQSIEKAKLKVCEKSFQLCCYTNLELLAYSSIHTKQYAECRMHHRSGTCMPVNQMLSQLGSPSYA